MKNNAILIIVIICCALSWPSATCDAQGFAKATRSVSKCIRANKTIIGANTIRGYSIQEQQRHQIAQNVVRQTLPSTIRHNTISATAAKSIVVVRSLAPLTSSLPYDFVKPLEVSSIDSLSKATPTDSTFVKR